MLLGSQLWINLSTFICHCYYIEYKIEQQYWTQLLSSTLFFLFISFKYSNFIDIFNTKRRKRQEIMRKKKESSPDDLLKPYYRFINFCSWLHLRRKFYFYTVLDALLLNVSSKIWFVCNIDFSVLRDFFRNSKKNTPTRVARCPTIKHRENATLNIHLYSI